MTISRRDNYSLGCAGLAAGTNAGTLKTLNAVAYQIDGRSYFKAPTDNLAFTLFPAVGTPALKSLVASQTGVYFVMIDPAGNVTVKMAPKNSVTISPNGAGYSPSAIEWPQEDKGYACLGAIRVATNGSGAFTPGTTALGAANQTVTYFNAGPDLGVPISV